MRKISLYQILRVGVDADENEIRSAYSRHLANLKVMLADDEKKLKGQIGLANIALEVLTDPNKRKLHDKQLSSNSDQHGSSYETESAQRPVASGVGYKGESKEAKQSILLRPLIWLCGVVWSVFGPILRIGIQISVLVFIVWFLFISDLTADYRSLATSWVKSQVSLLSFSESRNAIAAYDTLRCEKARLRVAEAEKIKKRNEDRLKFKDDSVRLYALGKIIQGNGRGAVRDMAEAGRLTKKERDDLARADELIKASVINDLECFRAPEKNR